MFYTIADLSNLNRKELQKLCKKFNLKGNGKNVEMTQRLYDYFKNLQKEENDLKQELKGNIDKWLSDDEEGNDELNSTFTLNKENTSPQENSQNSNENNNTRDELKNQLMQEVERRAEEKITKIPRFVTDNKPSKGEDLFSPTSRYFKNQHSKNFNKMASVDDYLANKRKRAEQKFTYQKKLKLESEKALQDMQFSHNTPKPDLKKGTKPVEALNTPTEKRILKERKKTATFTKSNLKVDKDISFNFGNKKPSFSTVPTRLSSRSAVLKERHSTSNTTAVKKTPLMNRKSVQFQNFSTGIKVDRLNQTAGDFRSPSVTIDPAKSSKKTPVKFDLQASLKKPLKYKPHTGKIKAVYFADRRSVEPNKRISTNQSFTGEPEQKQSVKEITRNVTSSHVGKRLVKKAKGPHFGDSRRAKALASKKTRRTDTLLKRRGISC